MTTALYAGSFDPITNGHIDIIKSSTEIFDKVIVGVTYNYKKRGLIPTEKRLSLIKKSLKGMRNVEVCVYEGLTVEFAKKHGIKFLIRGLRNNKDFEFEKTLASVNNKLDSKIRTVFLIAKPEFECISSSTVKELVTNNADISDFVPKCVQDYFKNNIV